MYCETMKVELTQQERDELVELLTHTLGELKSGVHHAMTTKMREDLHRQESVVRSLLDKLGASVATPR